MSLLLFLSLLFYGLYLFIQQLNFTLKSDILRFLVLLSLEDTQQCSLNSMRLKDHGLDLLLPSRKKVVLEVITDFAFYVVFLFGSVAAPVIHHLHFVDFGFHLLLMLFSGKKFDDLECFGKLLMVLSKQNF
jgi:hypothetical protein